MFSVKNNTSILSYITLGFLLIFIGWKSYKHAPNDIISWDVYGHYLYLPATFVNNDPLIKDFEKIDSLRVKYNNAPYFYVGFKTETENTMIKYPLGFSVLMSPFFAASHLYASNSESYPADGFSRPYHWGIVFGCIFYVLLGQLIFMKVLRIWFSDKLTAILMLLGFFGTNLYFMNLYSQGMIHGILFGFYALLIYVTHKWHLFPNKKWSVLLGLTLGVLAMSRASEVLAIFIPLFWGVYSREGIKTKLQFLKKHKGLLFLTISVYVLCGIPQLLYFKLVSGHFFVDSYQNAGEGFDFLYPHTLDYLFSFRKGWLLYTPLMILSLIGLFKYSKRKELPIGLGFIVFALVNIYLLSAWTNWWYAESFGQRSIVQSYPVYIISLGFLLKYTWHNKYLKPVYFVTILGFVSLNQFQTWQVNNGLIDLSRMTGAAYSAHFLKTNSAENYDELLLINRTLPGDYFYDKIDNYREFSTYINDFETLEQDDNRPYLDSGYLNTKSAVLNQEFIYSAGLEIPYHQVSDQYYALITMKAMILCKADVKTVLPTVICKFRHKKKDYFHFAIDVEKEYPNIVIGEWTEVEMHFISPHIRHSDDDLQVFGMLRGSGEFLIDNLSITSYVEK
jgi:hypothetical protein